VILAEHSAQATVLCLFGAGGHGRVVAAQTRRLLRISVIFGDTNEELKSVDSILVRYNALEKVKDAKVLVTIGDNTRRKALQEQADDCIALALLVDPSRVFSEAIGRGSQILAGAIINAGTRIGIGTIVNSNAVVEHDCTIGAFCHIAPGAVLGGGASLGDGVLLGTGAIVLPGVHVAAGTTVGAGSVVTRDIDVSGVWFGAPARQQPVPMEGN
jgi:sugar O-acyltransferase (sialic acid O-acetyltransferase NeuD family)